MDTVCRSCDLYGYMCIGHVDMCVDHVIFMDTCVCHVILWIHVCGSCGYVCRSCDS